MIVTTAYITINKSHMEILCFNIRTGLDTKSKSGATGSPEILHQILQHSL
jgi:hypothetical protein